MLPTAEVLFERYRDRGDSRALASLFDRTAPEVFAIARHLTRDRDEADELVQSTWLAALESARRWRSGDRFVPWLLGILANRLRMSRRRRRRERALAAPPPSPGQDPLDLAVEGELRELLRDRLERLPETYRAVLVLQLEHGLTAAEVARALGRPRATVRSQLHRGLELLRLALPREVVTTSGGERPPDARRVRGTVLAAAGPAAARVSMPFGATILMKKLLAVSLAALAVTAWLAWPLAGAAPPDQEAFDGPVPSAAVGEVRLIAARADHAPSSRTEVADPQVARDTAVVVRTVWYDGRPAASMWVCLEPAGSDDWFAQRWQRTDPRGIVRYAPVGRGLQRVRSRHGGQAAVDVATGTTAEVDLRIPAGVDVLGVVVGPAGDPVPGAVLVVGTRSDDALEAARSGADGAFFLRAVGANARVAAFADGYLASQTVVAGECAGGPVVLRLAGAGGVVSGRVLDADGQPISGAWVAHGYADLDARPGSPPAVMRIELTDERGEFRLQAVPLGQAWPLHAGAARHCAWRGSVRAMPGDAPFVEVRLERSVRLQGVVHGRDGEPLSAHVRVIDRNSPGQGIADQRPSWSRAAGGVGDDGAFSFSNLPPGRLLATARGRDGAVAVRVFDARPGDELEWSPVLRADLTIHGRVVDERGVPLPGHRVVARGDEGVPAPASSTSAEDGAFALAGCADAAYAVRVYAPGDTWQRPVATMRDVTPSERAIELCVEAGARPSCTIAGRLAAEQPSGVLSVVAVGPRGGLLVEGPLDAGARFEIGPVPPGPYALQLQRTVGEGFGQQIVAPLGSCVLIRGQSHELGEVGMPAPGELAVELVDAEGRPVPNARLVFVLIGAPMGASSVAVSGGRGLAELSPGFYLPTHASDGLCIEHEPIAVESGARTTVRLVAARSVVRRVRYDLGAFGTPMRAEATWAKDGRPMRRQWFDFWQDVPTELDEAFTPGRWTLELTLGTGAVRRFPVVVTGEPAAPVIEIVVER